METIRAAAIFEVFSSSIRLDVFRLLAENAPDGLVAGDIARILGIPASNLSFHLKALMSADLAAVERKGRFLRYRANIPLMLEAVAYLAGQAPRNSPEPPARPGAESGAASSPALPKRRVW